MKPSPDRLPPSGQPRPWSVTRWEVWRLPGRVIAAIVLFEALAVALVGVQAATLSPRSADVALAGGLALLGVVHTEIASTVERIRRRVSDTSYYDLSSVWTFAAALLLPPPLAAGVVVTVYLHLWVRVWRPARSSVLHRNLYTTAAVVLAAQAAHAAVAVLGGPASWLDGVRGLGVLVLTVLTYAVTNNALVILVLALNAEPVSTGPGPDRRAPLRNLLGKPDDLVLEVATLALGAITAVALTHNPWLVVLVLVPLLVLHRADTARQLERRAATDGKTGLLNAAAWHEQAERALHRAQRQGGAAGVLILDLDHFKSVNDTYGHLAGDQVLVAVAEALSAEVREGDIVGRFGGEEFVVLVRDLEMSGSGRQQLAAVAERIRARVERLTVDMPTPDGPLTIRNLSISVGGVFHVARTSTLQQVLGAADAALYAAKREGRNLVRFRPPGAVPGPTPPPVRGGGRP